MGKKVIGVILLIAAAVFLLFGFSYINSPQYKMMSMVNSFTGGSDPTGNISIGIGILAAIAGVAMFLIDGASKSE